MTELRFRHGPMEMNARKRGPVACGRCAVEESRNLIALRETPFVGGEGDIRLGISGVNYRTQGRPSKVRARRGVFSQTAPTCLPAGGPPKMVVKPLVFVLVIASAGYSYAQFPRDLFRDFGPLRGEQGEIG